MNCRGKEEETKVSFHPPSNWKWFGRFRSFYFMFILAYRALFVSFFILLCIYFLKRRTVWQFWFFWYNILAVAIWLLDEKGSLKVSASWHSIISELCFNRHSHFCCLFADLLHVGCCGDLLLNQYSMQWCFVSLRSFCIFCWPAGPASL